uniref:Uncharacterized protein n=1 Tax=Oryza rufipogon TaxID=4529 RepID=A0A0E0NTU7_ORYRU
MSGPTLGRTPTWRRASTQEGGREHAAEERGCYGWGGEARGGEEDDDVAALIADNDNGGATVSTVDDDAARQRDAAEGRCQWREGVGALDLGMWGETSLDLGGGGRRGDSNLTKFSSLRATTQQWASNEVATSVQAPRVPN